MANLYLAKTALVTNGSVSIPESLPDGDILIQDITKVSIGYNLVYVEYGEEKKIRAFGRKEFNTALIWDETNQQLVLLPLSGALFHRYEVNIPREVAPVAEESTEDEVEL